MQERGHVKRKQTGSPEAGANQGFKRDDFMNKWYRGSSVETQFKDRHGADVSKTGVGEHGAGAQTAAGACLWELAV